MPYVVFKKLNQFKDIYYDKYTPYTYKQLVKMASATNSFSDMFTKMSNRQPGMKGELEEKSTGSICVDVFSKMVQSSTWEEVRKMMDDMVAEFNEIRCVNNERAKAYLVDMVKLWAFKRDPHSKGEGNRMSSYYYFLSLAMEFPDLIRAMIMNGMIETYGNWKDMRRIIRAIHTLDMTPSQKMRYFDYSVVSPIRKHLMESRSKSLRNLDNWTKENMAMSLEDVSSEQIRESVRGILNKIIPGNTPNIPLLAKYIVSEKGADNKNAYWFLKKGSEYRKVSLVNYLVRYSLSHRDNSGCLVPYPFESSIPFSVFKAYRVANSKHKAALDLFESYFPRGEADHIDLSRVASRAKWNLRKALLNEKVKGVAPTSNEEMTGNRFPQDDTRITCRQNTRDYYRNCTLKTMQTKSILPHHITHKLSLTKSTAEQDMFVTMWDAMIEKYRNRITSLEMPEGVTIDECLSGVRKGNVISVFDTSGSMMWDGKDGEHPYDIAMGLTAFLSEIASQPYKNKAITFSSEPRLVNLANSDGTTKSLKERYNILTQGSGYSTDFYKTNLLLATLCKQNGVSEEDLPVMVIFSDEGWDTQTGMHPYDYRTHHEKIIQLWLNYGYTRIPTYVYWNLKEGVRGFQTTNEFPGVMFLQGRSPNLFDLIIYGEMTPVEESVVVIDGEEVTIKTNTITPEQNFRNAMSLPEFYDPLVAVLERVV